MTRREALTAIGALAALRGAYGATGPAPLTPPAAGSIPIAFPISQGAVLIDFAGPWEVFQNVDIPGRSGEAFHLYTVSETAAPITASGGMKIVPDYTFANAPKPKVIIIPAQRGSDAMIQWIRKSAPTADLTMSVCTGAFHLAKTGLLSGKSATTHHSAYTRLETQYPDIQVKRGFRFVEEGNVASAGGLTSGIDLALRVVERYYGHDVAENTAYTMEYQGTGWLDPTGAANAAYTQEAMNKRMGGKLLDPVCGMPIDPKTAGHSEVAGKTYYFCSEDCKKQFDTAPEKFAAHQ